MEPFFKSGEKKKRRNDLNDECQCFEVYKQDKDDEDRFVFQNPGFHYHLVSAISVSFINVTEKEVVLICHNMTKMVD